MRQAEHALQPADLFCSRKRLQGVPLRFGTRCRCAAYSAAYSAPAADAPRRSKSLRKRGALATVRVIVVHHMSLPAHPFLRASISPSSGMDNATEWQEVFKTAAKTALILVILDLLRLSKNATWFEEHVDFVSMQAVLFNGAARSWWAQTRTLVRLQARLTD